MARKKPNPELDKVEDTLAILLENGQFKNPVGDQIECNAVLEQQQELLKGDMRTRIRGMQLTDKLRTLLIRMIYGSADPRDVPIGHMKNALMHPVSFTAFADQAQRKSIDGPLRGIRIKCMECQGGDYVGIRQCAATNCPLWAFRMGANPFFARLSAEDADAESDETEADMEALEAERTPNVV